MKRVVLRIGSRRFYLNDVLASIAGVIILGAMVFFVLCWSIGAIR